MAGKVKLSEAQSFVLRAMKNAKPVAGNDEGWLDLSGLRRPSVNSLVKTGFVEARLTGPHTRSAQMHRLTPAGRAHLAPGKEE
jgi:hypothetical protein